MWPLHYHLLLTIAAHAHSRFTVHSLCVSSHTVVPSYARVNCEDDRKKRIAHDTTYYS